MDVSIILVNYNTKTILINCLNSIINHLKNIGYEIIVVDNGSSDGSQEEIKKLFPNVILIESKENLGFGKANNIGAEMSTGKYLFFLNSDTLLLNNAVKYFYDYFEANKSLNFGCLGCNLTDHDLTINGNGGKFPNIKLVLKMHVDSIKSKFFKRHNDNDYPLDEIEYVLGADMFMPREVFKLVNGFDERFFMYFEESDLQLRIHRLGFRVKIIDSPKIIHLEGKSSHNTLRKIIMVQSSAFKYFYKNRPYWEYCLLRILGLAHSIKFIVMKQYSFNDFVTYFKFNLMNFNQSESYSGKK